MTGDVKRGSVVLQTHNKSFIVLQHMFQDMHHRNSWCCFKEGSEVNSWLSSITKHRKMIPAERVIFLHNGHVTLTVTKTGRATGACGLLQKQKVASFLGTATVYCCEMGL